MIATDSGPPVITSKRSARICQWASSKRLNGGTRILARPHLGELAAALVENGSELSPARDRRAPNGGAGSDTAFCGWSRAAQGRRPATAARTGRRFRRRRAVASRLGSLGSMYSCASSGTTARRYGLPPGTACRETAETRRPRIAPAHTTIPPTGTHPHVPGTVDCPLESPCNAALRTASACPRLTAVPSTHPSLNPSDAVSRRRSSRLGRAVAAERTSGESASPSIRRPDTSSVSSSSRAVRRVSSAFTIRVPAAAAGRDPRSSTGDEVDSGVLRSSGRGTSS